MKEQDFDKVEAYMNGEMNVNDALQFEKELATNATLAATVDNYLVAGDAIELLVEDSLRADLEAWSKEDSEEQTQAVEQKKPEAKVISIGQKKENTQVSSFSMYRLAAAASVAMLLGFFGLQFMGRGYTNEALLEKSYQNFDFSTVRSGGQVQHPFEIGIKAYESGNFAQAIQFFRNIPTTDERYVEAQFYLGQSLYKNKNYTQAVETFQQVINSNDSRLKESAEWYKTLSYLANNDLNADFNTLLNQIASDTGHTFSKNAMELKGKLESFWRMGD